MRPFSANWRRSYPKYSVIGWDHSHVTQLCHVCYTLHLRAYGYQYQPKTQPWNCFDDVCIVISEIIISSHFNEAYYIRTWKTMIMDGDKKTRTLTFCISPHAVSNHPNHWMSVSGRHGHPIVYILLPFDISTPSQSKVVRYSKCQ